jgi:hypothetical protein
MNQFHFQRCFVIARLFVALCGSVACAKLGNSQNAPVHLKIAAVKEVVDSFKNWTAATPWEQIKEYKGTFVYRPTLDLVLELQALKAGGLDFDFELVPVPNEARARHELIEGNADLAAEADWDSRFAADADSLLKSDPLVRRGDFEKGIYTLPTNTKLLAITTIDELRQFVGATVGTWTLDVKILSQMNLKGFESAVMIENVFLMIQKQRADFTLVEFSSNPDLSVELGGVRLVPVPNCKVVIDDSRSWIINKKSPNADAILAGIQNGLKILRANGSIARAFSESGFVNPKVATWNRLF